MLALIPVAIGAAYIVRKKSNAGPERLNAAKIALVQKIYAQEAKATEIFSDFKEEIKASLDDEIAFKKPFDLLEAMDLINEEQRLHALTKFNYALKHNSYGRMLVLYSLLNQFITTINNIQDIDAIEWLDAHIGYYMDMVESLYFNIQDASYVKVANLIKERLTCNENKKASLDSDIATCKDIIEFIEFFLIYYRSMIMKIASDHSKIDYQDELHKKLRFLALVINRNSDCLRDIFRTKNLISELEEILPTQTTDWQIHRTTAQLARYRSQLALETLELYFLMVLKKYFLINEDHPIDALEQYGETYNTIKEDHKRIFPSIFVHGTEILNYEHVTFEIAPEILAELKSYQVTFGLPIPDYNEIFKYYQAVDAPIIKVQEAVFKEQPEPPPSRTLLFAEIRSYSKEKQSFNPTVTTVAAKQHITQDEPPPLPTRPKLSGPPIPPRPKLKRKAHT